MCISIKKNYILKTTYSAILEELEKRNIEYTVVYPKGKLKEDIDKEQLLERVVVILLKDSLIDGIII